MPPIVSRSVYVLLHDYLKGKQPSISSGAQGVIKTYSRTQHHFENRHTTEDWHRILAGRSCRFTEESPDSAGIRLYILEGFLCVISLSVRPQI
jgi:hypothetical protein